METDPGEGCLLHTPPRPPRGRWGCGYRTGAGWYWRRTRWRARGGRCATSTATVPRGSVCWTPGSHPTLPAWPLKPRSGFQVPVPQRTRPATHRASPASRSLFGAFRPPAHHTCGGKDRGLGEVAALRAPSRPCTSTRDTCAREPARPPGHRWPRLPACPHQITPPGPGRFRERPKGQNTGGPAGLGS